MKHNRIGLCLVLLTLVMAGCATMGINLDTPEKKCLAARSELNLLLGEYLKIQATVSDADHLKAKAAFTAADVTLDTWEAGLGKTDYNYAADMATWLAVKNNIIAILTRYADGS